MPGTEPGPSSISTRRAGRIWPTNGPPRWLRTGLTAVAVGLAVAKLLPDLAGAGTTWPYASLGIGFCVLGIIMMAVGIRRVREVGRALERGEFRPMDAVAAVWVGILTITLAVATIAIVLFGP